MLTPPLSTFRVAGDLVFVSGVLPKDPHSGRPVEGDIEAQTTAVLEQLTAILRAAGSSPANVIRIGAFLADLERDFDGFNRAYRQRFSEPFPARTTVGVELRHALVEIDAVALIDTSGA